MSEHHTKQLAKLGLDVLQASFDGGAPDPMDIQDMALELGLIEAVTVNEPCAAADIDQCRCLEYDADFPTTCLRVPNGVPLSYERIDQ